MADGIKISALTEATDAQTVDGNLLETAVVDSSSSTGFSSKKTPISRLAQYVLSKFTGLSLGGSARTVKTAIDALQTDVDKKADADGEYDTLVVGTSKQLLSESYTIDRTPYKFRKAPGTDRLSESIVGASVAWNQLANNFSNRAQTLGITITADNANGSITVSGTATATSNLWFKQSIPVVTGHKYLLRGAKTNGIKLGITGTPVVDSGNGMIINAISQYPLVNLLAYFENAQTYNETLYPQLFDLTVMFGATVADALYAMGNDGIKLFRSWYPSTYYPYTEATLEHVSGLESHEMVGFNQWDEEWIRCSYNDDTGVLSPSTSSTRIGSKNFIRVIPNETYSLTKPATVRYFYAYQYDADLNYLGNVDLTSTFTIPADVSYIKFYTSSAYGATYNHDICINFSGIRDGEYEPYRKHSYALDASLTLRGLLKYDSTKGFYVDGDTYAPDGVVTRRYGIVDLGTLNWTYYNESNRFIAYPPSAKTVSSGISIICSKYIAINASVARADMPDKTIKQNTGLTGVYVYDSAYTDANTFKTAMSGKYLVYELATPTTESAEPYDAIQITDGTEEYVTDCLAPVGHESKYYANLRSKIEGLPTDFSAIICATEATNKASKNYAVGDYLIYGNTLYKVTTAIATNATLTVGTNITATTIMAEIKALQ